jgi:CO/xanthine dehydrogenase Mo-binding subunit/CO/xanthine dehydrogenase FAD-binding subunit
MKHVGHRVRAVDWEARTSGTLNYVPDVRLEGMLHAAVLRSPHSLARIVRLDTSVARSLPGVRAIITSADLPPGTRYIHEGAADRAPLADGMVRFVGEEIAAVAADSPDQAAAAVLAIEVDYEVLEAPLNIHQALSKGAARLHERKTGQANVSLIIKRDWGDAEAARKASTVTVEGRYYFARQAHACMETNGSVAHWKEEEQTLHFWTSTQAPYYVVLEVSAALGLDKKQVICHEVGVGGGFGSKSKICEHEVLSGLLSRLTLLPVRLVLSREEEFETTRTRHPFYIDMQLHADDAGRLHEIVATFDVENGAYNHNGASVMSSSIKAVGMMYLPQSVQVTARLIDTATIPGSSFRGYGTTQSSFALESLMDRLAERLGIDAFELRRRNANRSGETTLVGAYLGSARLLECLDAAEQAIGWKDRLGSRPPGRGYGMAAGVHVSGSYTGPGANRSDAIVDVYPDSRVRVRFGGADAGTGQRTILAQIAAEELGVGIDAVTVLMMDSALTPHDMGAWSSRGTHYGGHAVRKASMAAATRLKALASARVGAGESRLEGGMVCGSMGCMSIGDAASLSDEIADGMLSTETSFVETSVELSGPNGQGNISPSYNYASHAAMVDVDTKTGLVTVVDYVAVHDIGTALNPISLEGQAIGGSVMGIGAALGEELLFEQGKVINPSYLHYALPRSADVPRVRPIMIEGGDPLGPYGAKAIGECSINPPPATLSNAIYDAVGIRLTDLPFTPDKIIDALAKRDGRRRSFAIWRRPSRWYIAAVRAAYSFGLLEVLHKHTQRFPSQMPMAAAQETETPSTLPALLAALKEKASPLGGGTDLRVQQRQGISQAVKLAWTGGVAELKVVETTSDGVLRIGAAVTLSELAEHMSSMIPILTEAINMIANTQIRELATVAGNLIQGKRCWFYRSGFGCYKRLGGLAPCYAIKGDHRFYHAVIDGHRCQATTPSDLATVFQALDATAVLQSQDGERRVPMRSFYTGPGETVLLAGELLTAIELPAAALSRQGCFRKLRLWEGDFAVVSVAIVATVQATGTLSNPSIVFGGLGPVPWQARETERRLSAKAVGVDDLRVILDRELNGRAHPLERNGWKLDAAAGLAEKAFTALTEHSTKTALEPAATPTLEEATA